jgi:hypothetical protein
MSRMQNTTKKLTEFQLKVKAILDEADSDVIDEFFASEMNIDCSRWDSDELCTFKSSCELEFHHQDNFGGEGCGDDYWSVYKFTNGTDVAYVKFQGWYQSYNGSEFSEWFFVEPKQQTITVYE